MNSRAIIVNKITESVGSSVCDGGIVATPTALRRPTACVLFDKCKSSLPSNRIDLLLFQTSLIPLALLWLCVSTRAKPIVLRTSCMRNDEDDRNSHFVLCHSAVGLNDEWAFFVPSLCSFPFQYFRSRPTQIGPGSNPNDVGFRSIRLLTG